MTLYQVVNLTGIITIIISFACTVFIAFQKPGRGQKLAMLTSGLVFVICLGFWGSTATDDINMMVFATKVEYIGACNVYPVILALYMMLLDIRLPKKLMYGLVGEGLILTCFTMTFDMNTFFYKSYRAEIIDGVPKLVKEYGTVHTIYAVTVLCYMAALIILFIIRLRSKRKLKLKNAVCFSLIALLPSIFWFGEKITRASFDLTSVGLLGADLCMAYLITQQFYDIGDIVLDMVFDTVDSAIIVFDAAGMFISSNVMAEQIFPDLAILKKGDSLRDKLPELADIFDGLHELYEREKKRAARITQYESAKENMAIYQVGGKQYKPVFNDLMKDKNVIGEVCMLTDVSAEYKYTMSQKDYQTELVRAVNEKTKALKKLQEQMVYGFASIVESKNFVTGGHIRRTSSYVEAIARELFRERKFKEELNVMYIDRLRLVAPLHDIGKISTPEMILDKPARLNPEETAVMQKHTLTGAKIVDMTMSMNDSQEEYQMAHDIAMYHHERWDGRGYPEGRKGRDIPLCARIMAVADVFDALVSRRPYKEPYSMDKAFGIILDESQTHFDPEVVDAFIEIRPEIEKLYEELRDR